MSTFMLKSSTIEFTPVNNIFIEKYMIKARGEFVKVYLLMLKYSVSGELGVSSSVIASNLNLLESDVMNALNYWNDEGIIKLIPIDKMGNFNIQFMDLKTEDVVNNNSVNLLEELNKNDRKDMLKDIEILTGRPLSPKEMTTYLSWQNDYGFPSEMILLLIEYCVSKGKSDIRYIEKVALNWYDAGIKTLESAQSYITKNEDKWIKIRKILTYMGIKNGEVMKPQQELLEKWLYKYNFSIEMIFKACEICFERLNRADFKYIDGILNKWYKDNIQTIEDVAKKDSMHKETSVKRKTKENKNTLRFNDYEQRVYDYDSLEKKLLGWDDND
ncbi:DnaD domain protein [Clostridium fallax]|uniref:DNA replication protein DnaD n=1 Tax=Clostridium fallax TaxID=1533 RepID=A0A1M4X0D9_9CLOT|nr:DnaD domain protein [Clostridium fallax]SHE86915.1 DNA replication protein DnaD [Clostridium fallax]SQB22564.1 chromosome replication initiation protein [Clostridium fallax]